MTTNTRSRWAALGAAVAVSLGAGGLGVVNATISSGTKAVFVPITPCRLVDTRPAPTTVGGRATPLNPGEIATFTVHGSNGNCTIPAGATSIATNVTVTAPTSDGFLTVFPADASLPNASNLNWAAGQAPTPNAVTVDLSSDGKVNVFNERGTVNVIIDIVGYYEDHNHDDSYYTKAQTDAAIVARAPVAASAHETDVFPEPTVDTAILSVTITAPVAGLLQMNADVWIFAQGTGGFFDCALDLGAGALAALPGTFRDVFLPAAPPTQSDICSTSGAVAVGPGTHVVNFVADTPSTGDLDDAALNVLFVPGGTVTAFDDGAVQGESKPDERDE